MWGIMLAEAPPLASSTDGLGAGIILAAPFCRHTRRHLSDHLRPVRRYQPRKL